MKVHGTRVGADGTGYYRGENGKHYYGNPRNGYLTETLEEQRRSAEMAAAQDSSYDSHSPSYRRASYTNYAAASGGGLLGGLLTGAITAVGMAAMLLAFAIFALFYSLLISWPSYIETLVDNYKAGTVDFAVILVTAAVIFLAGYFFYCAYTIAVKKQMKSQNYVIVCTVVITLLHTLFLIITMSLSIWSLFGLVLIGVSLSALPAFLLCFIEHLTTKKLRGDNRWFLTRLSKPVSRLFIGHSIGMIVFGTFVTLLGLLMVAGSSGASTGIWVNEIFTAMGVIFVIMGILARKK